MYFLDAMRCCCYFLALSLIVLIPAVLPPSVKGAEYRLLESFHLNVREPSGLAYDPLHDSLWTVEDNGGNLFEVDKKGDILKKIILKPPMVQYRLPSLANKGNFLRKVLLKSGDWEGIAYKSDTDTFLLSDERTRKVVEIDRAGKALKTITVPIKWHYWNINHGIEGVAYDPKSKSIFVANEKKPRRVMELKEDGSIVSSFDVTVERAQHLSDLYFDATTDRLLVLSRKLVLEFTRQGKFLKTLPIEATKAEGITKDSKGYLYVISETTSTLYVYAPKVVPTSMK